MTEFAEKLKRYSPVLLRCGLGVVFLLFGAQKLMFPKQGTSEIQLIFTLESWQWTMSLGMASAMNYYIGLCEGMLGISLFAGWMTRYAAPMAAFLVVAIFGSITFKYGLNTSDKTLLLDAGLIGSALGLWALVSEKWSTYAPVILRAGLTVALLLSGYQQMTGGAVLVGSVEFVLAVFLLLGLLTRYVTPLFVALMIWNMRPDAFAGHRSDCRRVCLVGAWRGQVEY
ncbi:DoxX family protein [Candidatus Azambacteria bacterium]|nr:DoxX family protein [Candidatus Azambacteria bacterium]